MSLILSKEAQVAITETSMKQPTLEELKNSLPELVPALREKAAWSEENRRLHEDSLSNTV
jgi:hypothetical protein